MALDYNGLQDWVVAKAVRAELGRVAAGGDGSTVNFVRECEAFIRRKVEALEVRTTLTDADRGGITTTGIYTLPSSRVREVRAAYATDATGQSYPLENVGVAGIRQIRGDADVFHYAVSAQTIEFRGIPAAGASLELVTLGWPDALENTSTNLLLTEHQDIYTYGTLAALYEYTQDVELADRARGIAERAAEDFNKLVRRRNGGSSVLPFYNFGQIRTSRSR